MSRHMAPLALLTLGGWACQCSQRSHAPHQAALLEACLHPVPLPHGAIPFVVFLRKTAQGCGLLQWHAAAAAAVGAPITSFCAIQQIVGKLLQLAAIESFRTSCWGGWLMQCTLGALHILPAWSEGYTCLVFVKQHSSCLLACDSKEGASRHSCSTDLQIPCPMALLGRLLCLDLARLQQTLVSDDVAYLNNHINTHTHTYTMSQCNASPCQHASPCPSIADDQQPLLQGK